MHDPPPGCPMGSCADCCVQSLRHMLPPALCHLVRFEMHHTPTNKGNTINANRCAQPYATLCGSRCTAHQQTRETKPMQSVAPSLAPPCAVRNAPRANKQGTCNHCQCSPHLRSSSRAQKANGAQRCQHSTGSRAPNRKPTVLALELLKHNTAQQKMPDILPGPGREKMPGHSSPRPITKENPNNTMPDKSPPPKQTKVPTRASDQLVYMKYSTNSSHRQAGAFLSR